MGRTKEEIQTQYDFLRLHGVKRMDAIRKIAATTGIEYRIVMHYIYDDLRIFGMSVTQTIKWLDEWDSVTDLYKKKIIWVK